MKTFKNKFIFYTFFLASIFILSTQVSSAPIPKAPNIDVSSYILIDYDSGMVIASKNPDLVLPPASITKIMTSYLAFTELHNKTLGLHDEVLISKNAWQTGGSKMFIEVGKKIKVQELLHGIITTSGNDASVAMAEHISGNEETFAIYMNQMADSLGMYNTNYANSTGLPNESLYTTARDISILARALIKNFPIEYKLYSQKEYVFNDIKQYSRNKLLYLDDSVDGIKTGFTKKAGYCLATSAKRGSRRLISIVLGAKSPDQRTKASKSLLEYGFRFYETHKLFSSNQELTQARVFSGDKDYISLGVKDSSYITIPRRQIKNVKKKFIIDQNLTAPVSENEAIGYVAIELEGKTITTFKLFAMEPVSEGSFYRKTLDSIYRYF
ncbi:MAG: D-alanyl-D-alanine carboxypeptidase [Gammaproteobacteria bacterium]|jgi:serine-type D-Ala-D-Ala carboxypeptidase (penicillin-binding protein 5/6)|nr:D-alanyl-D-alanine carboxypeptidase [Gammaproteobacteria bacterium]MBT4655058.1 D-alanyl-D-alanine carboxypeptidase [Gammaproteobacteria bacterium]MBT5762198.1 D-alanyl-D-alanine carboxypeptidase [Gammaproteobacteria bacterium]MBT7932422.1 D-alanyl-D-alanine carboxypeptidase [Gammaproteobacteria bacterium]